MRHRRVVRLWGLLLRVLVDLVSSQAGRPRCFLWRSTDVCEKVYTAANSPDFIDILHISRHGVDYDNIEILGYCLRLAVLGQSIHICKLGCLIDSFRDSQLCLDCGRIAIFVIRQHRRRAIEFVPYVKSKSTYTQRQYSAELMTCITSHSVFATHSIVIELTTSIQIIASRAVEFNPAECSTSSSPFSPSPLKAKRKRCDLFTDVTYCLTANIAIIIPKPGPIRAFPRMESFQWLEVHLCDSRHALDAAKLLHSLNRVRRSL